MRRSHEPSTRLAALDGGPDIAVGPAFVVVGRHPGCDVRIRSIRVSRLHCLLARIDGDLMVWDLGSRNGTRINGLRVTRGHLRPGDVLEVAGLRYRRGSGPA